MAPSLRSGALPDRTRRNALPRATLGARAVQQPAAEVESRTTVPVRRRRNSGRGMIDWEGIERRSREADAANLAAARALLEDDAQPTLEELKLRLRQMIALADQEAARADRAEARLKAQEAEIQKLKGRMRNARASLQEAHESMQDAGDRIQNARDCMQDARDRTQDARGLGADARDEMDEEE